MSDGSSLLYEKGWHVHSDDCLKYFDKDTTDSLDFAVSCECQYKAPNRSFIMFWESELCGNIDSEILVEVGDYFQDILNPTEEEILMLEIEIGISNLTEVIQGLAECLSD